jgi:tRNA-(ms[2]io[6]A)-hydroxylase
VLISKLDLANGLQSLLLIWTKTSACKFYISLLSSEARHYQDYLTLAEQIAGEDISERVAFFGQLEADLISSPDRYFKFHSGKPA